MEAFSIPLTQIMISSLPLLAQYAGVNLLVGTENGLMLLDRSGQGKVYNLINRRRFQQMDVLEGLNVLVTISGIIPNLIQCLCVPFHVLPPSLAVLPLINQSVNRQYLCRAQCLFCISLEEERRRHTVLMSADGAAIAKRGGEH